MLACLIYFKFSFIKLIVFTIMVWYVIVTVLVGNVTTLFSNIFAVQSFSCVQLFVILWTAACQASLSFTISQSLLTVLSIESMMPSNHLILCHPLLLLPSTFPAWRSFPMSRLFASGGQSIGTSASVLPMNILIFFFKQTSFSIIPSVYFNKWMY